MFKKLFLLGLIVVALSGCGTSNSPVQTNQNNTVTTTNRTNTTNTVPPGETRAEPIPIALKQVHFHIKVPSYFPLKVTGSYAFVEPENEHPNLVQVSLTYVDKNNNEVVTEKASNIKRAYKISGTPKTLSNGLTVMMSKPFDWLWTDQGISYELSAGEQSSSGNFVAPNITFKQMEQIVTSMK